MLLAARPLTAETPAYLQLAPMVSIHASNLSDAIRLLNDGLAGAGQEIQPSDCAKTLADLCFLPSFDGVDPREPVRYFLLSQNPPVAMPEQAVILPLRQDGSKALLRNLRERYAFVEGGSIKICAEPVDGKSVDPLYVAIADGNAMLSPNVDAIRWMAYNLQSKTVPAPPDFRQAPLSASVDSGLLGRLLEIISSSDEEGIPDEEAVGNLFLAVRELGVFLSAFQHVEVTVDATLSQWDASFRFAGAPGSAIAEAIAALKPPDDSWMKLFPNYACNRSASCIPGFVSALPASNRKWLANLAADTRIAGFGVIPSAFGIDEKLRPYLSGTALSAFVADVSDHQFGSITVSALKSPEPVLKILRGCFAANGLASNNKRITGIAPNNGNGKIAYDTVVDKDVRQKTSVGSASEAVSFVLNLNHVELAVRGNRLFVVRGANGLLDTLLADKDPSNWNESFSSLTAVFPNQPGETVLGGGSLEPVALARRIVGAVRDLREHLSKMPHQGGGCAWRMSRKGGEARFDLRLYSNEIIACNRLRDVNSETMQQLLSQLVMRHFQLSGGNGGQGGKLRGKLNEMRDK